MLLATAAVATTKEQSAGAWYAYVVNWRGTPPTAVV